MLACQDRVCRADWEFDGMGIFGQHAPGKAGDSVLSWNIPQCIIH